MKWMSVLNLWRCIDFCPFVFRADATQNVVHLPLSLLHLCNYNRGLDLKSLK